MPPRKKKAQKVEETPDEKTRRVVRQKVTELMNVPRAAYMGDAAALDALAQNLDGKELRGALNTPDDNGRTPCSIAAQNGKLDALKKMIELKADPSIPSYGGRVPLHFAAKEGFQDIVRYLIEDQKLDAAATDNSGNCSLGIAAQAGHLKLVEFLLEQKGVCLHPPENFKILTRIGGCQ
jgi:ankyrin repeat protein